ncbi:MAG: hypothetical protein ABWY04_15390 [Arthrobacter sp.]
MRLKILPLSPIIVLALRLSGCSALANDLASPTPSASPPETTSAAAASSQLAPITIQIDGETVTGTLSGNTAARSLFEQLPVVLR